jgi:hypothetical protein
MGRIVTINELKQKADSSRNVLFAQAKALGRDPKLYMHWTGSMYDIDFSDYHVCIRGNGTIVLMNDLTATLSHTWRRNTGAIGITLNCAYGATSNGLGDYPPTSHQIEAMAQVIAAIADGLWLTIDKTHVLTHGEAADNEDGLNITECYGPRSTCERWDLEFLGTEESPYFNPWSENGTRGGDVLRGKANWYRNQWKK